MIDLRKLPISTHVYDYVSEATPERTALESVLYNIALLFRQNETDLDLLLNHFETSLTPKTALLSLTVNTKENNVLDYYQSVLRVTLTETGKVQVICEFSRITTNRVYSEALREWEEQINTNTSNLTIVCGNDSGAINAKGSGITMDELSDSIFIDLIYTMSNELMELCNRVPVFRDPVTCEEYRNQTLEALAGNEVKGKINLWNIIDWV